MQKLKEKKTIQIFLRNKRRKQKKNILDWEKHMRIVQAATNAEIYVFSAQMPEEKAEKRQIKPFRKLAQSEQWQADLWEMGVWAWQASDMEPV